MKIPWKSLTKEPLVIMIDEVYVIVGPNIGKGRQACGCPVHEVCFLYVVVVWYRQGIQRRERGGASEEREREEDREVQGEAEGKEEARE